MNNISKASLSLVVIGVVISIICACLYPFVKKKEGERGERGPSGDTGKSLSVVHGSLVQINTNQFNEVKYTLTQYNNLISLQANGTLQNIVANQTYNFAMLPPNILKPKSNVFGSIFIDNSKVNPILINPSGLISIGPLLPGTIFVLNVLYLV